MPSSLPLAPYLGLDSSSSSHLLCSVPVVGASWSQGCSSAGTESGHAPPCLRGAFSALLGFEFILKGPPRPRATRARREKIIKSAARARRGCDDDNMMID